MISGMAGSENSSPSQFRGLHQAVFVLEQLCKGHSRDKVIEDLNGDQQLVDMWMNFLIHNQWVIRDIHSEEWVLTEKGKRWIYQIEKP
jgi:hypothetical protein